MANNNWRTTYKSVPVVVGNLTREEERKVKRAENRDSKVTVYITDGIDEWNKRCPSCLQDEVKIVEPGLARCASCQWEPTSR